MSTASKLEQANRDFKARLGKPQISPIGQGPGQPYDPKNPVLSFQSQGAVPLRALFEGAPTPALYDLLNLINEILGTRPDAKR